MRTKFDIGQIIRCHGDEFLSKHQVVPAVRRAFAHMAQCRTSALGGHVEVCPECGICISATIAVETDIAQSVRTRSVKSGLTVAGKKSSPPSTSMSFSRCLRACIPLQWPISGSSTTVCSRLHGLLLMLLLPRRDSHPA